MIDRLDNGKLKKGSRSTMTRLLILNFITFGIFMSVQIITTYQVGSKSQEVDYIRSEKSRLRQENEFLKSDIQKERSLAGMQDIIERYDLRKADVVVLPANPNENFARIR